MQSKRFLASATFGKLFRLSLVVVGLVACQTRPPITPKVECMSPPPSDMASLCVKAAALQLGPADEIEAYHPVQGLQVMALPRDAPDGFPPSDVDAAFPAVPLPDLEEALANSRHTDKKGNLFLSIEPGDYLLCAVSKSLITPQESVSRCELVAFDKDNSTKLLITHSPWGDFLGFAWQD